jgi:drug/metabolite transporter (DMT)-like permease
MTPLLRVSASPLHAANPQAGGEYAIIECTLSLGAFLAVKKRSSSQPYFWMLTSCVAFSWMVILANLAAEACPWQIIALVRAFIPLILLAAWAKHDGVQLVFWGSPALWMRSIAGSCSLIGSFYSFTHMPPAEANCLQNAFPIWVALLSWPLLGEWPSRAVWLSILMGVCGVVLIQRPDVEGINPVALVAVAVSVFTALAMMGLHRLKHLDPRVVVVHFSGVSVVFSVAALLLLPVPPTAQPFQWQNGLLLLAVGLTATVGQLFLTKAFAAGAPARVSVVCLTQVIFILILDALLLGHIPDSVKLLGVAFILAPTAWIMLRPARRTARPTPRGASASPAGRPAYSSSAIGSPS